MAKYGDYVSGILRRGNIPQDYIADFWAYFFNADGHKKVLAVPKFRASLCWYMRHYINDFRKVRHQSGTHVEENQITFKMHAKDESDWATMLIDDSLLALDRRKKNEGRLLRIYYDVGFDFSDGHKLKEICQSLGLKGEPSKIAYIARRNLKTQLLCQMKLISPPGCSIEEAIKDLFQAFSRQ